MGYRRGLKRIQRRPKGSARNIGMVKGVRFWREGHGKFRKGRDFKEIEVLVIVEALVRLTDRSLKKVQKEFRGNSIKGSAREASWRRARG